jgi:hypothetical protein
LVKAVLAWASRGWLPSVVAMVAVGAIVVKVAIVSGTEQKKQGDEQRPLSTLINRPVPLRIRPVRLSSPA